jgi:hypothetical protein
VETGDACYDLASVHHELGVFEWAYSDYRLALAAYLEVHGAAHEETIEAALVAQPFADLLCPVQLTGIYSKLGVSFSVLSSMAERGEGWGLAVPAMRSAKAWWTAVRSAEASSVSQRSMAGRQGQGARCTCGGMPLAQHGPPDNGHPRPGWGCVLPFRPPGMAGLA